MVILFCDRPDGATRSARAVAQAPSAGIEGEVTASVAIVGRGRPIVAPDANTEIATTVATSARGGEEHTTECIISARYGLTSDIIVQPNGRYAEAGWTRIVNRLYRSGSGNVIARLLCIPHIVN